MGDVTTRIAEIYVYKLGKISTQGERRRPVEEIIVVTPVLALILHQTGQGWEVEESLNTTILIKVEKRVETKMIQSPKMDLYETHESREVRRN